MPDQPPEELQTLDSTLGDLGALLRSQKFTIKDVETVIASALAATKPENHHRFIFSLFKKFHEMINQTRNNSSKLQFEEAILKQLEELYKENQELYSDVNNRRPDPFSLEIIQFAALSPSWKLRDLLFCLFGFNEMKQEKLVQLVRQLMISRQYQVVCVSITSFDLQQSFDAEQVLLPLVMLNIYNYANLIERYLRPHTDLQNRFIGILDSLCINSTQPITEKRELLDLPNRRDISHLQPKLLQKVVFRLRKSFNTDLSLIPNAVRTQTTEAMRYLVNQKYKAQTISDAAWEEVVSYTVKDDDRIKHDFIELLISMKHTRAADQFARRFGMLASFPSIDVTSDRNAKPAAANPGVKYHSLCIPDEEVHIISTIDQLNDIAADIELFGVVGIDMEWRATYTIDQDLPIVSIVQLAIGTQVFLLDMATLDLDKDRLNEVSKFYADLFGNDQVTKLGYDFQADIVKLQDSYPYLKPSFTKNSALVDLKTVQANVEAKFPSLLAINRDDKGRPYRGLTELLVSCLGEPLDKTEQLSDWEKRPLRHAQKMYAALDAYCLLEIYDFLDRSLRQQDPPSSVRALSKQNKTSDSKDNRNGPSSSQSPDSRQARRSHDRSHDRSHGTPPSSRPHNEGKEEVALPDQLEQTQQGDGVIDGMEEEPIPPTPERTIRVTVDLENDVRNVVSPDLSPDESCDLTSSSLVDEALASQDKTNDNHERPMTGGEENSHNHLSESNSIQEGFPEQRHNDSVHHGTGAPGGQNVFSVQHNADMVCRQTASPTRVDEVVTSSNDLRPANPKASETIAADSRPMEQLPPQIQPRSIVPPRIDQSQPRMQGPPSPWQQHPAPEYERIVPQNSNKAVVSTSEKRRRNRVQGSGALGGFKRPGAAPPIPRAPIPRASLPRAPIPRAPIPAVHGPMQGVGLLGDGPIVGYQPGMQSAFMFQDVQVAAPVEENCFLLSGPGKHILSRTSNGESWVMYIPDFLQVPVADKYFALLHDGLNWQQRTNVLKDGTEYQEPRQSIWFGEFPYTYSRVSWNHNTNWNPHLKSLLRSIEYNHPEFKYNSVLCNLYRNGRDSIAWHSDDEYGLGKMPNIASMSLGDSRSFEMKLKDRVLEDENKHLPFGKMLRIPVTHGSLLIMGGATQDDWLHSVPKEYHDKQPRINLTFRWIYQDNRDHQVSG